MRLNPRKKPTFRKAGLLKVMKHLGKTATSWRRPRGIDSKQREKIRNKPRCPTPGYGAPKALRYLHPSGLSEVLVYNPENLEGLDPKKQAVMISAGVGNKKRVHIQEEARKKGLRVLNEKEMEKKWAKSEVKKGVKEAKPVERKGETKAVEKKEVKKDEVKR